MRKPYFLTPRTITSLEMIQVGKTQLTNVKKRILLQKRSHRQRIALPSIFISLFRRSEQTE